jgi:branched-chain amino acid transport system substrate-binding protein
VLLTRRILVGTSFLPLAAPFIGRARADQPIRIGAVAPLTGSAAESGRYQVNGVKLALDAINASGGVLGRPLELTVEDDQTTNPGAVLAFSRLVARGDIAGYIGSIRSTQVHAMTPDIEKAARPVMIGGTDPSLTHTGARWLFRCRPNDSFSARVIADFGVNTLQKKKWVIVHSTDAFGTGGMKALSAALEKLGLKPVLIQGYSNQQADFTPLVLAVKQADADVISSYFTFENDLAVFARQLRQLGVQTPWIGSPSIVATTALNLGGRSLFGTYGIADFNADSSPEARSFADRYEKQFKARPDNFSSWSYDAMNLLARAITDAKGTDPEAVRNALIAIRGYKGVEGTYNFDTNGDGLHGYNIVRNENGKVVFDRHIEFED